MNLDAAVLHALYAAHDPLLVQIFIRITEFGSFVTVGGVTLCLALWFLLRGRISLIAGLMVTVSGTAGLVFGLKEFVARARPDAIYQAYVESGFSFPSGHAALAVALYGFCIYVLWRAVPRHQWAGTGIAFLNLLILSIAFSRLYLGIHYLSDVLGGALVGAIFLALGIYISERLKRSAILS